MYNRVYINDNDYINASYINYPLDSITYIATQAPLPSTIIDFWNMTITNKVNIIIMLSNLNPSKVILCDAFISSV